VTTVSATADDSQRELEVSVVVESYTHGEGSGLERVGHALRAATAMIDEHGVGEVLVADSSADPALAELLEREFPRVRRVDAARLGYDEAKLLAAEQARGTYVLYLDGDCIPSEGWLEHHLAALRSGRAATGGFTRYDGDFFGAIGSVLDFGFLLPVEERVLDCYAFNNSGFRRDVMLGAPPPEGPMRCRCYAHAQRLQRRGLPVWMVPEARVRHERQPFFRERYRQGFDMVAARWIDPALTGARLLKVGPLAAPIFYGHVIRDWQRLVRSRRDLQLAWWQLVPAAVLAALSRLVDLAGMVRALVPGGRGSGVGMEASPANARP
jgi:glycosyltransferase involved in cell wall biosynthesis